MNDNASSFTSNLEQFVLPVVWRDQNSTSVASRSDVIDTLQKVFDGKVLTVSTF